jgi:enamine deaminase RidA (YjgF/YER057c/UK114 family)
MSIKVIVPEGSKKTYDNWHFAPAVQHNDLIFFSGVVGRGDTPEEEFRNAWASLGETLAEAGIGYEDIIDTTLYVVDLQKNVAAMAKAKDEFIKAPYPTSTWIGITELVIPGARAEIKVIARKAADS